MLAYRANEPKMNAPLSIAHRGGRGLWPENTLHAFECAIAIGCTGAELDVQLTRDGRLVVAHDFVVGPATYRRDGEWWRGPRLPICDVSFNDLRAFDVGRTDPHSEYGRKWPEQAPHDGERVPLLSEVLDLIGARDFHLLIEIKTAWQDRKLSASPESVADATLASLREKHFTRATLVSFDWAALIHARRRQPSIPCWFLTLPAGNDGWQRDKDWAAGYEPSKFGSIPRAISAAGGQGWLAYYKDATADAVSEAHALGLKVGVWNINDIESISDYAPRGVDAICSDYPNRLVTALRTAP